MILPFSSIGRTWTVKDPEIERLHRASIEFSDKVPAVVNVAKNTISMTIHGRNQLKPSLEKGKSLGRLNMKVVSELHARGVNRKPSVA